MEEIMTTKPPIVRVVEPGTVVTIGDRSFTVTEDNWVKHGVVLFKTAKIKLDRSVQQA
jgi:hypothetical protein